MRIRYRGVTFGEDRDLVGITDLTVPTTDLRSEYTERLNRDGILPSRDWLGAGVWQFNARTVPTTNLADALAASEQIERVWKAPTVRDSTTTQPMDYSLDGGDTWHRVYGRPGPYTGPTPDRMAVQGRADITAEFQQLDPAHYSAEEHQVVIPVVPASHGGIVAPLVAPITTVASGTPRVGGIDNAGDLPSPARVVFQGPCTNPVLTTDKGYKIGYVGSIAYDQTVTISAWDSTIIKSPPRASVAGDLDRRTRLSRLVVPSGHSEWYFEATDSTGTASAAIYWRDAYTAMQH